MVYLFLKHGMRWTTLRGLKRDTTQAMLVIAAMNLKKVATWLWKTGHPSEHKRTPAVQFFAGVGQHSGTGVCRSFTLRIYKITRSSAS
ncbi:hypothetical protein DQX05_23620 [Paenibacillus thiaminolyticus]|uniref:Transposase DDE domain-containing protein n=1 Tax=Paenibacillus thiaminolyticus TaxID=49283 RepID=A0A3A3GGM4_PANTH|nr:hypothetical protein DQX05_23620 [Paenibacillus thiaminolyticus]